MENYKPNSFLSKEKTRSEKQVDRVIAGTAKVKKKSDLQKLAGSILSEDVGHVKTYLLMDVLLPAVKKAILDIVTNGTDMLLYGEGGRKKKSSETKVSYQSYYAKPQKDYADRPSRRDIYDFDNLLFETREDAQMTLDSLMEIASSYDSASVSDLYDLAGVDIENTAAANYGWTNLAGSKIVPADGGYILKLPKPIPIV